MSDPFFDEAPRVYMYEFKTYNGKRMQMYGDLTDQYFSFGDLRTYLRKQAFLENTLFVTDDSPQKHVYVDETKVTEMFPHDTAFAAWRATARDAFIADYNAAYP